MSVLALIVVVGISVLGGGFIESNTYGNKVMGTILVTTLIAGLILALVTLR
jgi:hypothetical protein